MERKKRFPPPRRRHPCQLWASGLPAGSSAEPEPAPAPAPPGPSQPHLARSIRGGDGQSDNTCPLAAFSATPRPHPAAPSCGGSKRAVTAGPAAPGQGRAGAGEAAGDSTGGRGGEVAAPYLARGEGRERRPVPPSTTGRCRVPPERSGAAAADPGAGWAREQEVTAAAAAARGGGTAQAPRTARASARTPSPPARRCRRAAGADAPRGRGAQGKAEAFPRAPESRAKEARGAPRPAVS